MGEGSQRINLQVLQRFACVKQIQRQTFQMQLFLLQNEKKLVSAVDKDHPATLSKEDIEVTLGDKVLRYGI